MRAATLYNFYSKIEFTEGCWNWTGSMSRDGYGRLKNLAGPDTTVAHRYSYAIFIGDLDPDMTIDHLCRNRACVKPTHLEQVSLQENILRGDTLQGINARKTQCKYGHPFDDVNTIWRKSGARDCRTCANRRHRALYANHESNYYKSKSRTKR